MEKSFEKFVCKEKQKHKEAEGNYEVQELFLVLFKIEGIIVCLLKNGNDSV